MKKLFCILLAIMMTLCAAAAAQAEGGTLTPLPVGAINTQNGNYLAEIDNLSTAVEDGYINTKLYQPDYYAADALQALQAGDKVAVDGQVFTVSETHEHDEGEIEIYTQEEFDGYIVFKPHGDVYSVLVNDETRASYAGDYTIMMPLPNDFCFIDGSEYDMVPCTADQFLQMISTGKFSAFGYMETVLSFRDGMPMYLGNFVYGIDDADDTRMWMEMTASETPVSDATAGSGAAGSGAVEFKLVPITWDGVGLGKTIIPAGYALFPQVHCMDETCCLGSPLRLSLVLSSSQDRASIYYYCSETYMEWVRSTWYYTMNEGQIDEGTKIWMKYYKNAYQYSDELAERIAGCPVSFHHSEDMSFYDSRLAEHYNLYWNEIVPGMQAYGLSPEWMDITAANNVYTYELAGTTWAINVMVEVRAYQYNVAGDEVCIWEIPEYYALVCPLSDYERISGTVFRVFTENTAVSDTFIDLQGQLTEKIAADTINAWNSAVSASMAYAAAMDALMTQSVNAYLSAPTYSTADRFSDYIFDQNNYVSSDGSSIKVSTAYDYVWDNGGGDFGFSSSAFDVPAGAELLYPSY